MLDFIFFVFTHVIYSSLTIKGTGCPDYLTVWIVMLNCNSFCKAIFQLSKSDKYFWLHFIYFRWFELQSIDIIEKKFAEDPKEAMRLIDCNAEVWKIESSPLEFAHENFMFDVVAHPCSIRLMNKRWYNNLQPELKVKY